MNLMDTPLCQVPFGEYLRMERTVGVSVQLAYSVAMGLLGAVAVKLYQRWQARKVVPAVFSDDGPDHHG